MLGLLHRLTRREGLSLAVAHVDHGLREGSNAEGEMVRATAGELKLPFAMRRLELDAGPGLPARARLARHAALREMADEADCSVVALRNEPLPR